MLKKLSKILYIFLISLLILWIIIYFIKWKVFLDTKIFYLFFLLLFPFIDTFIESVRKDFSIWNLSTAYWNNLEKYAWLVVLWIIMYFYGSGFSSIWIILFLAFSLLFRIDSRVSFVGALILLILTPLYLIIWDKEIAESVSIFAYYFLIIWVVLEIRNQIFPEKSIKADVVQKEGLENKYSIFDEILDLAWTYINKIKQKILETKDSILEEIWESPSNNSSSTVSNKSRALEKTDALISKVKNTKIKQIFYIKLLNYFIKKLKENIASATLLLFCINVIIGLLLLNYSSLETFILYTFGLLIISYLYSKFIWTLYDFSIKKSHNIRSLSRQKLMSKTVTIEDAVLHTDSISQEEFESISTARNSDKNPSTFKKNAYFLNKASIFASLWLVAWYFLIEYFKINQVSTIIYIAIFSLFFLSYYLIFSDLDSKLLGRWKRARNSVWNSIQSFSIKDFFKRHIYMILNLFLISSILIVLWLRTWIFADWYKGYQERVWYENWELVKEKIKELTRAEKDEKIIEITKKLSLISWEAEIQSLSWTVASSGETIETQNNIKINVREYHIFQNSLKVWAKTAEVTKLEEIMKKLNYFDWTPDTIYDEVTKNSLTNLLKKECDWPETTKWILGNKAMQCLYSLEIEKE